MYADWQPATMAGVLWLLIVGLGASAQKKKSSQGINLGELKNVKQLAPAAAL